MTLEMKGIYKSFGANDVLRDVSFTLNGGEICALLGENGAGKSTLMNILGGVHHADQGQILLDGTGKKSGRGAYVCPDPACLKKARKNRSLERAFDTAIPPEVYDALEAQMEGGL